MTRIGGKNPIHLAGVYW